MVNLSSKYVLRVDSFRFTSRAGVITVHVTLIEYMRHARPLVLIILIIYSLPAIWCRENSDLLIFFINFNKKESFCPFFLTVPTSCILYFTFQSLFSFSKSLGFNYIPGFNFIRVYHFIICSNFITRLYLS